MRIVLAALQEELVAAWKTHCGDLPNVEVLHGSILESGCNALVSPANSFGFMDGGIDLTYSEHFGWHVQERLQEKIRRDHHGELLVGAAEIVETDDEEIPFVIAAPTMRVPMSLRDSVSPFLAARAALLLVREGSFDSGEPISSKVESIAFPGLGTGTGRVAPLVCARQVAAAIKAVLLGEASSPRSWEEAEQHHRELYQI